MGDISRWERRYQFWSDVKQGSPNFRKIYQNKIAFRLRRGDDAHPIPAGYSILPAQPSLSYEIDDRRGPYADGTFDTDTGKVTVEFCGFSEGG